MGGKFDEEYTVIQAKSNLAETYKIFQDNGDEAKGFAQCPYRMGRICMSCHTVGSTT